MLAAFLLTPQGFSPLASPALSIAPSRMSSPAMVLAPAPRLPLPVAMPPVVAPPVVEEEKIEKRKVSSLPKWAKQANEVAGMPLFTKADAKHAHAATAAAWLLASYFLLYSGLWKEYTLDDWSTFANFDAGQALMLASGIGMAGTGFPMLPKSPAFKNYAAGLRNGLLAVALSACMAGAFMVDGWVPSGLVDLSGNVASLGMLGLLYDFFVEKQPWDQRPVLADLKLEMPPEASMNAQHALSVFWLAGILAGLGHMALADGTTGLTDLADPAARAFAAQLAVGLGATPTVEAFFAGSLLYKDRFTKPKGKHVFTRELLGEDGQPNGKFGVRLAIQLPLQILFSFPGPAATTVLLALSTGHADVVRQFFFIPSW